MHLSFDYKQYNTMNTYSIISVDTIDICSRTEPSIGAMYKVYNVLMRNRNEI